MSIKGKWAVLVVLLCVGLITYLLIQTNKRTFIYPNFGVNIPQNYPVFGIDVSHHQGEIDFTRALSMREENDSVMFVYIKATEGADFADSRYDANAEGVAAQKVNYGFYHYFHPKTSARQQANFFSETIKGYNFKLIPVIDVEVKEGMSTRALVDSVYVFLNEVERQVDSRPMVYTFVSFYRDFLRNSKLKNELFWLAAYSGSNAYMEEEQVVIWQFSESGTVNGIETPVDLNVAKSRFNQTVVRPQYHQ